MKITKARIGYNGEPLSSYVIEMIQAMLDAGYVKYEPYVNKIFGYDGFIIVNGRESHWYMVNVEE